MQTNTAFFRQQIFCSLIIARPITHSTLRHPLPFIKPLFSTNSKQNLLQNLSNLFNWGEGGCVGDLQLTTNSFLALPLFDLSSHSTRNWPRIAFAGIVPLPRVSHEKTTRKCTNRLWFGLFCTCHLP